MDGIHASSRTARSPEIAIELRCFSGRFATRAGLATREVT